MSPPPRSLAKRWTLYGMVLLALGAAVDATLVEPNWIEVVRTVERLPMLRPFAPVLTLVHISDLHVGSLG